MKSKNYPYHVYMLRCIDGSLYTGITNDLERRILQHNGTFRGGARYTKMKGPVTLVYIEKYETRSEAARREIEIKRFSHAQKEALVRAETKKDVLKNI